MARSKNCIFDGGGPSDVEKGQFSVASQRQVTGTFRAIYYLSLELLMVALGGLYNRTQTIDS